MRVGEGTGRLTDIEPEYDSGREEIMETDEFEEVSGFDSLASGDLQVVLDRLIELDKEIEEVLEKLQFSKVKEDRDDPKEHIKLFTKVMVSEEETSALKEAYLGEDLKFSEATETLLEELENRIEQFESVLREYKGFLEDVDIFRRSSTAYKCEECGIIRNIDGTPRGDCKICETNETERIPLNRLKEVFRKMDTGDMLIEFATSRIFSSMEEFESESGLYVKGRSGIKHEIDVVAEDKQSDMRYLVECKTGSLSRKDVLTFASKVKDIGCDYKFLISERGFERDEVADLARHHSINTITNFYVHEVEEIEKFFRECSQHIKSDEPKKYSCSQCNEQFEGRRSKQKANLHLMNKHGYSGEGLVEKHMIPTGDESN